MAIWERVAIVILCLALVFIIACFLFRGGVVHNNQQNLPGAVSRPTSTATSVASTSIGGQIYSQIVNPIKNKLPNANPVKNANPVQGLYQNPF